MAQLTFRSLTHHPRYKQVPLTVGASAAGSGWSTRKILLASCTFGLSILVTFSVSILIEQAATGNFRIEKNADRASVDVDSASKSLSSSHTVGEVSYANVHRVSMQRILHRSVRGNGNSTQVSPPMKHMYGMIGNVHSDSQLTMGLGERARGMAAGADDYVRWSAVTQLVSAVMCMKAIEEELIQWDDDVYTYIPELEACLLCNLRVLTWNDTANSIVTGTQAVPSTSQIKVSHLLTHKSGNAHLLWRQGQWTLPGLVGQSVADEEFIWDAYPEHAKKINTGMSTTGECPSNDASLKASLAIPLVRAPGEAARPGNGYAIAGAVLTEALRRKNHTCQTAAEYMRKKILDPLGMTDTWIARVEVPPADVSTRLAEAFLLRVADPTLTNDGFLDQHPRNNVSFNYLYSSTGAPTWSSDVLGDSYYCLIQGSYEAKLARDDNTRGAGGVETELTGPLHDLSKFFYMMTFKGMSKTGKRVISESSVRFLLNPTTTPTSEELRYFQGSGQFGIALPEDLNHALAGGVTQELASLPYPIGPTTYTYTS